MFSSVRSSCLVACWQLEENARQWNGNSLRIPPVWKHDEHITTLWVNQWPPSFRLFPVMSSPSTTLSSSPSSARFPFRCPSLSHTDLRLLICLLCFWQQAVFAERLPPHHLRCPTLQPLLTSDPDRPTCPLSHAHAHTLQLLFWELCPHLTSNSFKCSWLTVIIHPRLSSRIWK